MSDQVEDLSRLDEMHKSGSLSDAEYEEAKRKLLDAQNQQPQTTIVHTRERSSFGSIIIGGLLVIALIAIIFWFLNKMGDDADSADLTDPGAAAQQGTTIELQVPDLEDGGEAVPAE